jgi:RNA polymerase sigma-70 factor, ECF subfamily
MLGEREFSTCLLTLQRRLERWAWRLTKNAPDAGDLVQATNLRALEKRRLFVRGSSSDLTKWLFRIMLNLHRDGLRAGSHEMKVEWLDELPGAPEADPALWTLVDDGEIAAAIQRLPPRLRSVYELFATERCSYARIADRLGMPIKTVGTQMFRARDRLRRDLAGPRLAEVDRWGDEPGRAFSGRRSGGRRGAEGRTRGRPAGARTALRASAGGR